MTRNLVLLPAQGAFDTRKINEFLESQPGVARDPHGTNAFILGGLPEAAWSKEEERLKDATKFPYGSLVFVAPDKILVNQEMADAEELRSAMTFVRWLWDHFELTIRDDYGPDLTERAVKEGVECLYPEKVRSMPVPWAGRLIKIGFFRELDHGDSDGPSLELSRSGAPASERSGLPRILKLVTFTVSRSALPMTGSPMTPMSSSARRISSPTAPMPGQPTFPITCASTTFDCPRTSSFTSGATASRFQPALMFPA